MRRAVAISMAMLASAAYAAETKTYKYTCRGGAFSVTALVDNSGGFQVWSKTEPIILKIGDDPPQTLVADPDAPEAQSYKNKDYEFYALKTFITLTSQSHGVVVKFYDACRVD